MPVIQRCLDRARKARAKEQTFLRFRDLRDVGQVFPDQLGGRGDLGAGRDGPDLPRFGRAVLHGRARDRRQRGQRRARDG